MREFKTLLITIIIISSGALVFFTSDFYYQISVGESTWTQTSDRDFNEGSFNNTIISGTGNNAELTIELSGLDYWNRKTHAIKPSRRVGHAMASIYGTNKILLNAGTTGRNETWLYDLVNDTWTRMFPNPEPPRRQIHAMASILGTDKVLLFGGYEPLGPEDSNKTWIYDLSENKWSENLFSTTPLGRSRHAMASIYGTDKILLFGGWQYSGSPHYLNDTWIYEYSNDTWTEMHPSISPTNREKHAMAFIWGTDKVVLFGGTTGGDETWVYDLSKNSWTEKFPKNIPSARSRHGMATIYGDDKVILFGGYTGVMLNDTWVFDLSDNNWTKITPLNPLNNPSARGGHAMASVYGTDKIVLYGGYGTVDYSNDTWIYEHFVSARNGTYVSKPFDTGTNSSFKSINWFADLPSSTALRIQLRTANSETELGTKDFIGPNGATSSFYIASGASIWPGHTGDRWVQYKVCLNMNIFTEPPKLKEINIVYNCLPETIVIDPQDNTLLTNNKPTFYWTFSDLDSDKQKAFQILIANDTNFEGAIYDTGERVTADEFWEFPTGTNYTELPDGTWYWKVRTKDGDEAWTKFSAPRKIRIDTHAPTSTVRFPENNGFYRSVSLISGISHDNTHGSGLNKIEIVIKRLNDNNYWDGAAWIHTPVWLLATGTTDWTFDCGKIKWTSGTKYSIQSRANDIANNVEQPENVNIFTIDTATPKSKIDIPEDNNWLNKLNSISGTAFDLDGADVEKIKISIKCTYDSILWGEGAKQNEYWDGGKWTNIETWLFAKGTHSWHYDTSSIPWTSGNHYTIYSRAYDLIGNIESITPGVTFMYDATPPENCAIYINNDDKYTISTLVNLSLAAEDFGSGVAHMALSVDGITWSEWELFNTTRTLNLLEGDGNKTIFFKVQDYTGNIAEPTFDSILLDTTPPEYLSIKINDNAKYTNSRRVELKLKAVDSLSGVNDMSFSLNGKNWQSEEAFQGTRYLFLTSGDGEKTVYFKVVDKVGNVAEPVSDSIILDTTPAFALSISINNGEKETNSTRVMLFVQAFDNASGVSQISFSSDGETGSIWKNYTKSITYDLPSGNGIKTIYFRAKDKAGNDAKPVHSYIILNIPSTENKVVKKQLGDEFWTYIIFMVIIIIIFILIIIALLLKIRKRTRATHELLSAGALTIKLDTLPGVAHLDADQVTGITQSPQLPGSNATPTVALIDDTTTAQAPQPQLAKSTHTAQPSTTTIQHPGHIPQPLPQLPPIGLTGTHPIETTTSSIPPIRKPPTDVPEQTK